MPRIQLPTVTLCAATSVNVAATMLALQKCMAQIDFAQCVLFTSRASAQEDPKIRVVAVEEFSSSADYSDFILSELPSHIDTEHCLIAQWDGFVLDAEQWDASFLDFDYIGAPWPQFDDGHDVGNGGFSLRSRKLLQACRDPRFRKAHPEDIAICRVNRDLLEREHGVRFADRATAQRFSVERSPADQPAFGFHGIFNMARLLGPDEFWQIYRTLDHKGTAFVDYLPLLRQLGSGSEPRRRQVKFSIDYLAALAGR